ncbi:hypothetical protein TRIP_B330052 [uncultured Desulfatiglans sp.]|uniref:Uncharacterized protein n=1 Tax=Uncultured Desulfatiglans sp. TaxID=1748965 RepID=A0A653A889_UNCDX|nr:hypothetical protein TRIP_B330052 [uncultured Desulfatiglans sp.]
MEQRKIAAARKSSTRKGTACPIDTGLRRPVPACPDTEIRHEDALQPAKQTAAIEHRPFGIFRLRPSSMIPIMSFHPEMVFLTNLGVNLHVCLCGDL